MTRQPKKKKKFCRFEELDVLAEGLDSSPRAWTSFRKAQRRNKLHPDQIFPPYFWSSKYWSRIFKVLRVFLLAIHCHLYNGLWPETSTKLYAHEFRFWSGYPKSDPDLDSPVSANLGADSMSTGIYAKHFLTVKFFLYTDTICKRRTWFRIQIRIRTRNNYSATHTSQESAESDRIQAHSRYKFSIHCKKKVSDFAVLSQDVANQTLPGGRGG